MPGRGSVCFHQHSLCQMEPLGQNKILTDNPINAYFPSGHRGASVHSLHSCACPLIFKARHFYTQSGSSIFLFLVFVDVSLLVGPPVSCCHYTNCPRSDSQHFISNSENYNLRRGQYCDHQRVIV